MSRMPPRALLAIGSDIAPEIESEYLDWLTREHMIERVGIEGFVSARIYRCGRDDIRRYLILYELENAAVVDSAAYLERLNNPTPWTTRMMPHLGKFVRGGGTVVRSLGTGFGATVIPIAIPSKTFPLDWERLEQLSKASQVISVRLLEVDADRTLVATNERSMRSGDGTFDRLLLLDVTDKAAFVQAANDIYPALLNTVRREAGDHFAYSLVFCLPRFGMDRT